MALKLLAFASATFIGFYLLLISAIIPGYYLFLVPYGFLYYGYIKHGRSSLIGKMLYNSYFIRYSKVFAGFLTILFSLWLAAELIISVYIEGYKGNPIPSYKFIYFPIELIKQFSS